MLTIRNVSKRFGGLQALRDVSLQAEAGAVTAVIGPNGAGKSTLMNVISGFIPADAGEIRIGGADITGCKPHQVCRHGLARTFQNLQMFSDMTVAEVVVAGRARHMQASLLADLLMLPHARREEVAAAEYARALLDRVSVGATYQDRRAGDLPYGLQRRVEIARALATEPAMLLLDEPAAGLNDDESAGLGETLKELAAAGTGIILIEHDIDLVMNVSGHLVVLDAGAVIATGTPDEVRVNPAVVKAYLGDDHGDD